MDKPKRDLSGLAKIGNVVHFPYWATKDFEKDSNLDKREFEFDTPESLQLSFKISHERAQAAADILSHITEDDIAESNTAIQAYYEMGQDAEGRMSSIMSYIHSQGWEYEILPDGILHFPSLDNPK